MTTLICLYNLIPGQNRDDYDKYVSETKIPGIRGAPWCAEFNTWKVEKVLAPAVSEPKGELPAEPPYAYVSKIEVTDLDVMVQFLGTTAGQDFMKSWSVYIEPTAVFTVATDIPAK